MGTTRTPTGGQAGGQAALIARAVELSDRPQHVAPRLPAAVAELLNRCAGRIYRKIRLPLREGGISADVIRGKNTK